MSNEQLVGHPSAVYFVFYFLFRATCPRLQGLRGLPIPKAKAAGLLFAIIPPEDMRGVEVEGV
jgi:hypothetical protein